MRFVGPFFVEHISNISAKLEEGKELISILNMDIFVKDEGKNPLENVSDV